MGNHACTSACWKRSWMQINASSSPPVATWGILTTSYEVFTLPHVAAIRKGGNCFARDWGGEISPFAAGRRKRANIFLSYLPFLRCVPPFLPFTSTPTHRRGSRVVFPNGAIDPWHALGVMKSPMPGLPTIFVKGEHFVPQPPACRCELWQGKTNTIRRSVVVRYLGNGKELGHGW